MTEGSPAESIVRMRLKIMDEPKTAECGQLWWKYNRSGVNLAEIIGDEEADPVVVEKG